MTRQAGLLELLLGSMLRLDGREWAVETIEPQFGRVLLQPARGEPQWRTIRWLVHHPDCLPVPGSPTAPKGVHQPVTWSDLDPYERSVVRLRAAHVNEAETGFRSGSRHYPAPGEPRPAYDPNCTTLEQRRRAKAAELAAWEKQEAHLLGLDHMSERTLRRMAAKCEERRSALGCADGRWTRSSTGRHSITEEIREAIFAARAESLRRSKMNMKARCVLIHQYVLEKFGPQIEVPSYWTLRVVWLDWFGPDGARQRYARSAAAVETSRAHIVVHRPGQVVALDTTTLPVKVRERVFGDPVSACLTLALDLYTHSVVAFRLTLVSETSVDVAMLLRDVMLPLPMRDGWGPEMEWPYPGVPAEVVAEFAGHKVAGLPFFAPETVTTDHGSPFKNHDLVDAQRVLGCNILPARVLRPTDKQAVERAFGALRSLLFEELPGYTGVDVADRGGDPEADAVLTLAQMERTIARWVVAVWQNRRLGEHAPAWGPGEEHSPNTLFAAAMEQGGFALQIPTPELYYEVLPAHYVKIPNRRGVQIAGLWYDGPALDPYRGKPSGRGGRHKNRWEIHRERRDRRTVFFQDPQSPAVWHELRWNGLPPEGEIPAFSDKTVEELLHQARAQGLSPRSDAELLPVLLELLGGLIPVDQWHTQQPKQQRTSRARQTAQADAARQDRQPAPRAPDVSAEVVPLAWPQQARQAAEEIDAERRRRREAVVTSPPQPPPLLHDALRRKSIFLIPDDDDEASPTQPEHGEPSP
ncbi:transposase [Nonomuraea sp. NPDC003201]